MQVKSAYKQILRRIRRLPLDSYTLNKLSCITRTQFATPLKFKNPYTRAPLDTGSYHKYTKILDDILIYENWGALFTVFDFVFKDNIASEAFPQKYKAYKTFINYSYEDVRDVYPSVHLLKELDVPANVKTTFDQQLEEEVDSFSVAEYFNVGKGPQPFEVIQRKNHIKDNSINAVVKEVQDLYHFIVKNPRLTHLTLQPFEVAYPPDQYGRPLHIRDRDKLLKQKITAIKSIINQHRPITFETIQETSKVYDDEVAINPLFFKTMASKRKSVKVALKGNKKFLPSAKNIKKLYKDYFTKQCYFDPSKKSYVASPVRFYE